MTRLVLALFACLAAAQAGAQAYPDPLSPFVSDYAEVLDPATEARITEALEAARRDPGTEIAVVTLPSLADFAEGADIETFATGLFNSWGIGEASRMNGILILVVAEDRAMRLELGSGYGVAYDTTAENVVDGVFLPAFREGDLARGIEAGTEATIARIAVPFARNAPPATPGLVDRLTGGFGLFLVAAAGILALALRHRIGDAATRLRRCPNCGRRTLSRHREILRDPEAGHPGEGRTDLRCASCDYHDERPYPIPARKTAGRGGFGGGGSSGGGATGRW